MSLWNKVSTNAEIFQQIQRHYGATIPISLRIYLADWLEAQLLQEQQVPQDDPRFQEVVTTFFYELINRLIAVGNQFDASQLAQKYSLDEMVANLKRNYQMSHVYLYNQLRDLLRSEQVMVEQFNQGINFNTDETLTIKSDLEEIMALMQMNGEATKKLNQMYQQFNIFLHNLTALNARCIGEPKNDLLQATKKRADAQKEQGFVSLTQTRIELVEKFGEAIKKTQGVQVKVLNNLEDWKYIQSKIVNGFDLTCPVSLDMIQSWYFSLTTIVWTTRLQIKEVIELKQQLKTEEGNLPNFLPNQLKEIDDLLKSLMFSSMIIEKQPPQVLKMDHKFEVSLRLLTGHLLNIQHNEQPVVVTIEHEEKIADLVGETASRERFKPGDLLNNRGKWEFDQNMKHFSATLRHLKIKKERPKKEATDSQKTNSSVVEEKSGLLFRSKFTLGDLVFDLWTYSMPIALIVHGSQESQACSAIIWDVAFGQPKRIPFVVPDEGPWNELAKALSGKFKINTGRGLSRENLQFIYEKAGNSQKINWARFCKDHPAQVNTFWQWFFQTAKFTKDHLKDMWRDELIYGFISRTATEELLRPCMPGTFLLRFSDSEPGSITIAYRGYSYGEVLHIQPFDSKALDTHCLSKRISDLNQLITLYPNKPKAMFAQYKAKEKSASTLQGYITATLTCTTLTEFDSSRSSVSQSSGHSDFCPYPETVESYASIQQGIPMEYQSEAANITYVETIHITNTDLM